MATSSEDAVRISVEVSAAARDLLAQMKTEHGVPNVQIIARLLEWFAAQDLSVRLAVLSKTGDAGAALAKIKLAEMAAAGGIAGSEIPANVSQACELIRKLADKVERAYENMEHVAEKATKKKD
ncbi:MAG TPA: hypothetical protein VGN72_19830 [Tepidisphaeraceae bacterium]|nr:hypothetical protein [Tepidisphaeraceae bacterium]